MKVSDDELVEWLEEFFASRRYAPSMREVMAFCGYTSSSSVMARLERLRREGRVDWNTGQNRTLRVVS